MKQTKVNLTTNIVFIVQCKEGFTDKVFIREVDAKKRIEELKINDAFVDEWTYIIAELVTGLEKC